MSISSSKNFSFIALSRSDTVSISSHFFRSSMIVGKHTMQVFQGDLKNLISLSKSNDDWSKRQINVESALSNLYT